PPTRREHVVLHESIHTSDADRRQQTSDRSGDEADEQGYKHEYALRRFRVESEWLQRDDGKEKDDGEAGQQDVQRNLVWSLLTLAPLYESNHAIEKGLARVGSYADSDLITQHPRAAGYRGSVTASFANDRS